LQPSQLVNLEHSLLLRTFHVGGTASNITSESSIIAKYNGIAVMEELRTVSKTDPETGGNIDIVIGRLAELRIVDKNTGIALSTHNIPYSSKLYIKPGSEVKKGDVICEWDPYNAVIISEVDGKVAFDYVIEGVTFREESDEQTGYREKVIIDTRDKSKNPMIKILGLRRIRK
jgi:DNA-directed RNA polymerase subunit beta'